MDAQTIEALAGGEPDPHTIPRRVRVDKMTAAELAIRTAIEVVEAAGADVRLTDAVILLGAAKDSVADFVDDTRERRRHYTLSEWTA